MKETTGQSSPSALMIALLENIANERILRFPARIFIALLCYLKELLYARHYLAFRGRSSRGRDHHHWRSLRRIAREDVWRSAERSPQCRQFADPGISFPGTAFDRSISTGTVVHPVCESCAFSSVAA